MFKWNRILVAIIGVPLLLFIYTNRSLYGIPLLIFSLFIVGIGLYEFYNMVKNSNREVYSNLGIIIGLLIIMKIYLYNFSKYISEFNNIFLKYFSKSINTMDILVVTVILILVYRVLKNQIKGSIESVSTTLLGLVYISIFFSEIINLYFKTYDPKIYFKGLSLILVIQILVWISDTTAGIVGVSIGRKFFKNGFTEISPKKSIEGAIGSLLFTGLGAVIISYIYSRLNYFDINILNYFKIFILGIFIAIVAQIGDLIESLFKRECQVKDSGKILMGHGGILDRFDSMLIVLPVCSFLLTINIL